MLCLLCIVYCVLLVIGAFVSGCSLVACQVLFVVWCFLFVVCWVLLFGDCCLSLVVRCYLFVVSRFLFLVIILLVCICFFVCCGLLLVHFLLDNVFCFCFVFVCVVVSCCVLNLLCVARGVFVVSCCSLLCVRVCC